MNEYKQLTQEVIEGNINPLEAYVLLKKHQADIEEALKAIKDLAIDEANKYGQKSFAAFGAQVELRNAASTWVYSGSAYESAKAKMKYIETLAKAGGGIDPDTGEIIDPAVKKEGASTIAVSLKW